MHCSRDFRAVLNLSGDVYLWIKALHIISVIAWLAGLLYLPRLFVYHCEADKGSEFSEKLKTMEKRLMKIIMRPARMSSVLFGVILLLNIQLQDWLEAWLICKLILVLLLYFTHDCFEHWRKLFESDNNNHSQKFFRVVNEIPTAILIVVIIMVVVKPFS